MRWFAPCHTSNKPTQTACSSRRASLVANRVGCDGGLVKQRKRGSFIRVRPSEQWREDPLIATATATMSQRFTVSKSDGAPRPPDIQGEVNQLFEGDEPPGCSGSEAAAGPGVVLVLKGRGDSHSSLPGSRASSVVSFSRDTTSSLCVTWIRNNLWGHRVVNNCCTCADVTPAACAIVQDVDQCSRKWKRCFVCTWLFLWPYVAPTTTTCSICSPTLPPPLSYPTQTFADFLLHFFNACFFFAFCKKKKKKSCFIPFLLSLNVGSKISCFLAVVVKELVSELRPPNLTQ